MIVTCLNCDARFQLDESRVPEQGTHVRCSACKDVFFLDLRSESEGLSDRSDTESDEEVAFELEAVEPLAEVEEGVGSSAAFDLGEEFPSASSPAPSSDFDQRGPFVSSLADSEELLQATPLAEDDFSNLETPDTEPEAEIVADEDLLDGGSWALLEDEAEPVTAGADPPKSADGTDRLDEAGGVEARNKVAIGAIALESVPAGSHRGNPAVVARSPGLRKRLRAMGRGLGWGLTIVLVLLALMSLVREIADSVRTFEQSIEVGPLRVEGVRGEWVDTMAGKTLLAVTGELHNPSGSGQILGAVLEVSLVGSDGRRLALPPAAMGVRITESEIRELPMAALESTQNRAALKLARMLLPVGESVAVQAIFSHPPDDAVHFALDLGALVERSPGD
ncbi:MAG TPA: hypothetical protein EYG54_08985 [Myxococcales bacterium]|nr:hypothetical protein [Myxococcales bacterium]